MCRNITVLRGLDPEVTPQEVDDAARQFVRKVAGLTPAQLARDDVRRAVTTIALATQDLLDSLPARRGVAPGPASRRHPPSPVPE